MAFTNGVDEELLHKTITVESSYCPFFELRNVARRQRYRSPSPISYRSQRSTPCCLRSAG